MQCGLFGKLGSKRDFVAVSAPRAFLSAWEPWMQSCVSASRDSLGDSWLQAYLAAPIWRFWLGADTCGGATVLGALMSSVDGMGRYYPLTVFACASQNIAIAPPDIDPHEDWFAAAENFLLSTLDRTADFESIKASLDQLAGLKQAATSEDTLIITCGVLGRGVGDGSFVNAFGALRVANSQKTYSAATFWWTLGGGDYGPFAFCSSHLPSPSLYAKMLNGQLASAVL
jgi:type VI secretion system protein ImpM